MLEWLSTYSVTEIVSAFITAPLEQLWVGLSLIFGLTTSNQYSTLVVGSTWGFAALVILVGHMSTGAEVVFHLFRNPHSVRHPSIVTLLFPSYITISSLQEAKRKANVERELSIGKRKAAAGKEVVGAEGKGKWKAGDVAIEQEGLPFFLNFDVAIYYVILFLLTGVISAVLSPPLLFVLFLCKGISAVCIWVLLHIKLSPRPLPEMKRVPVMNTLMALGNFLFETMIGPGGVFPIAKYQDAMAGAE